MINHNKIVRINKMINVWEYILSLFVFLKFKNDFLNVLEYLIDDAYIRILNINIKVSKSIK